jgi:glycosyltransferase involved in cell wall biosynthesis
MDIKNPELSIVIPFFNEEESINNVCDELYRVISTEDCPSWEVIMVDDGSKDRTPQIMDEIADKHDNFRALHLTPNSGQSAALEAGFNAASGKFIATLDGDGQNDPNDILHLLNILNSSGFDMVCGIRKKRTDSFIRRISGRIANSIRSTILEDHITDIGCSLRVFRRDCMKKIKFFRNAHRFFPALFLMNGFTVSETPVNHRPREFGTSKYGLGINSRLWTGIIDLAGVYWLKRRKLAYRVNEK